MKIYVASSWRNIHQPAMVECLRASGFDVYDFKNPQIGDYGFAWIETGIQGDPVYLDELAMALQTPRARAGFNNDSDAMDWADACVLVLPCGRSAHLEAGWFMGRNKPVIIFGVDKVEPELMYLLGDQQPGGMYRDFKDVVKHLKTGKSVY